MVMATVVLGIAGTAQAAGLPATFTQACPEYGGVRICSGSVPSFDGATLDVDLTLPAQDTGTDHPLLVMLHGFGNNKHEWESLTDEGDGADKSRWNNRWFARHGYYVITYTARGLSDDGPTADYQPPTPADPAGSVSAPNGTIHVKSREWEIRDTQWLAALTAATFTDIARSQVAVTGGSYGGGESWLQASQPTWDFPHRQDASLPVLELQVAVPKYPWTDLAYSLAPNGHGGGPRLNDPYESSQARPDDDTGGSAATGANPLGVPKSSYITALSSLGATRGVFATGTDVPPGGNGQESIPAWQARIAGTGDPYLDADPVLAQARRGLTEFRSAYYQDEAWRAQVGRREVAVFSIQGWTDDLFEAVESFRMFKALKRLDPLWPVEVALADIGHSRAQNKPATWQRLNERAFGFLQSQIGGSHRQQTGVSSEPTICASEPDQPGDAAADEVRGRTPEELAQGSLRVSYRGGSHVLANPLSGGPDPNGPGTDPIVAQAQAGDPCRTSTQPALGGYTGVSEPLSRPATYVGLGEVRVGYVLAPAVTQAQLDARVWDVPPDGPAFLVTRGTFRLDTLNGYDRPIGTLRLPLFGNHWLLARGHRIRLDLTQVDAPFLRPNTLASTILYGTPQLVLPTRAARNESLSGAP
jgi:dienelactone hydrolase